MLHVADKKRRLNSQGGILAYGCVAALSVVINLNIFKDCGLCLSAGSEMLMKDHFKFYCTEKCLRTGVVVRHSGTAHATYHIVLL